MFRYSRSGTTPSDAYHSLIHLYCRTNGRSNDFLHALARRRFPPADAPLGPRRAGRPESGRRQADRGGHSRERFHPAGRTVARRRLPAVVRILTADRGDADARPQGGTGAGGLRSGAADCRGIPLRRGDAHRAARHSGADGRSVAVGRRAGLLGLLARVEFGGHALEHAGPPGRTMPAKNWRRCTTSTWIA